MSAQARAAAALFCLVGCTLFPAFAEAHTPTVSVLMVHERAPGEFITRWERTEGIADIGDAYELLRPVFPEHCRFSPPRLECGERGLSGRVGFDGLGDLGSSGILKIQPMSGDTRLISVTAAQPHVRVIGSQRDPAAFRTILDFVVTGILHIWLGLDHLLFVLGLLWFLDSWRLLVQTITAFTVAHSLTLGAATFGFRVLPSAPVEATIALSIAFVAVEIAGEIRAQRSGATRRRPWAVAFAFGLLHGFGFAGALGELEISTSELPLALLGFNAGVELGQVAFVAGVLAVRPAWRRLQQRWGTLPLTAGYYAMGTAAMYWFYERVAAFFPGV